MEKIFEQLIDINLYIKEHNVTPSSSLLTEGATYYDLRSFLTVLRKMTKDDALQKLLKELIKTVAKLEVRNVPVPTIAKLKSISPELFPS